EGGGRLVLVLLGELQLAGVAAVMAATTAARSREGVFMRMTLPPEMAGRKARPSARRAATPSAAGTDRPSHEGRYRPTRQESTWLGPRGRGRHSCGTAPEWPVHRGLTGFPTRP